jgi:hypothetical protein
MQYLTLAFYSTLNTKIGKPAYYLLSLLPLTMVNGTIVLLTYRSATVDQDATTFSALALHRYVASWAVGCVSEAWSSSITPKSD